jgi:hypothetical protein
LRKLKEDATNSIEGVRMKRLSTSTVPNLSKKGKEIYTKMSEKDEELALMFRIVASKETLVKSLFESMKDVNFIDKARKLISSHSERQSLNLTRNCP